MPCLGGLKALCENMYPIRKTDTLKGSIASWLRLQISSRTSQVESRLIY